MFDLSFKYGLFEGLKDVPVNNGTLYITTDEKMLYADLGGERISIGQIVVLDTFDWENSTPPKSTKAFYYVVDKNALLKYDETNSKWIHINDISTLQESIDGILEEIEGLKEANTTIIGDISDINKVTGYVGKFETDPTTGTVGDVCLVGDAIKVCVSVSDNGPAWEAASSISARLEALKAAVAELETNSGKDLEDLEKEVERIAGLVDDEESGLAPTKAIADKAAEDILAITNGAEINDFAGVETALGALNDTYATDDELSQAVAAARGETEETVASVDAKAVANAEAIDELSEKLTNELQAADALVYKGTVAQVSDLPTAEVKKGWTYKLTRDILKSEFDGVTVNWATTGEQPRDELYVRAGDILIATGDEDATTGFITSVVWDHIPAGYNADYVPLMAVAEGTDNSVVINLTSAHAATDEVGDLGAIEFITEENSALNIALTEDNKVKIGLAWGTF